jgi:hypothetical protein
VRFGKRLNADREDAELALSVGIRATAEGGKNMRLQIFGIWGLPTYYVIDATGKVSYIHVLLSVNAEALGKRLREAIEKAQPTSHDQSATSPASSAVKEQVNRRGRRGLRGAL